MGLGRLQDFSFELGEIDYKPFIIEDTGMQANFEFPGVAMNVDTVAPVPANVVGKIDINAFVDPIHRQTRLVVVGLKKQPENKGKTNFLSINPPLGRLSPPHVPIRS